ncbi:hypothetical protein ACWC2T_14970 [Streptomyces sp. NPDC001393]
MPVIIRQRPAARRVRAETRAVAGARSVLRLHSYAPLALSVAASAMRAQGGHAEALAAHGEQLEGPSPKYPDMAFEK